MKFALALVSALLVSLLFLFSVPVFGAELLSNSNVLLPNRTNLQNIDKSDDDVVGIDPLVADLIDFLLAQIEALDNLQKNDNFLKDKVDVILKKYNSVYRKVPYAKKILPLPPNIAAGQVEAAEIAFKSWWYAIKSMQPDFDEFKRQAEKLGLTIAILEVLYANFSLKTFREKIFSSKVLSWMSRKFLDYIWLNFSIQNIILFARDNWDLVLVFGVFPFLGLSMGTFYMAKLGGLYSSFLLDHSAILVLTALLIALAYLEPIRSSHVWIYCSYYFSFSTDSDP
jgi:hypothetical protein